MSQLQSEDARVEAVFFALVTANALRCHARAAQSGFSLHDALQYRADVRRTAARLFGLGDYPVVLAVAPGSPAAIAGIVANDQLVAVNGTSMATTIAAKAGGSYDSMKARLAILSDALNHGQTSLTLQRNKQQFLTKIVPAIGCAFSVQLLPAQKLDSGANGLMVTISSGLVEFTRDDDELAMVLAHELAHNILNHRAELAAKGVGSGFASHLGKAASLIRVTELQADRLSVALALTAGYRPEAALEFWTRYRKSHGGDFLLDATHPATTQRMKEIGNAIDQARMLGGVTMTAE